MEAVSEMKVSTAAAHKSEGIHWKQLWSLTALYASINIGWIAYQNYQPKLLEKFHFTSFTFALIVAQGIILSITPPIAGLLGDRFRLQNGNRLPVITLGISFAAMIFMAVAFTLFSNPGEIFKWILPVLIIFWLIAMSIFTSPALSTLELFTPSDKLARAMAVLTIVSNLIYALEPVIVDIIDYIGAPLTFISGGLIVFISGSVLRSNSIALFKNGVEENVKKDGIVRSDVGFILFMGICLGIATTVLFNIFPAVLESKMGSVLPGLSGKLMVVGILILSGLLSLPLSSVVDREGMTRSFYISLFGIILSGAALLFLSTPYTVIFMSVPFSIAFAAMSVSALPLTIQLARFDQKVFCVGIFFSGVAIPDAIVNMIIGF